MEKTGLKVIGNPKEKWYGYGYCGICGDTKNIIPVMVRFWDCDDGWKTGVLCDSCTEDCESRPPKETDYAYRKSHDGYVIDEITYLLGDDYDGAQSMIEDFSDLME